MCHSESVIPEQFAFKGHDAVLEKKFKLRILMFTAYLGDVSWATWLVFGFLKLFHLSSKRLLQF